MRQLFSKARLPLRAAAALLCVFALLLSFFVLIAEADHRCSGENCPVCAALQRSRNQIGRAKPAPDAGNSVFRSTAGYKLRLFAPVGMSAAASPVEYRTRLNN